MNFNYKENGGKKAFFAKPKRQYHVSQRDEHDWTGNNKIMEIITSIQVFLISRMNINYKENGGKKPFFQIKSINIVYPSAENMIVVPITKRMEIIIDIQVFLIS